MGPSVRPIGFPTIPSGTGYRLVYVHHGSCTLQSFDSLFFSLFVGVCARSLFCYAVLGFVSELVAFLLLYSGMRGSRKVFFSEGVQFFFLQVKAA